MSDSCQLRACWSMRPSVSAFCFRGMFSFHEALAVTRCESSSQARSGRASAPLPTALWFGLWSRSSCGSCSWVACCKLLSMELLGAWAGFCPWPGWPGQGQNFALAWVNCAGANCRPAGIRSLSRVVCCRPPFHRTQQHTLKQGKRVAKQKGGGRHRRRGWRRPKLACSHMPSEALHDHRRRRGGSS